MSLFQVNLDLDTVGLGTACSVKRTSKQLAIRLTISQVVFYCFSKMMRNVLHSVSSYLDDIISLSLFIGLQHLLFLNLCKINVGSFRCVGWHSSTKTRLFKKY